MRHLDQNICRSDQFWAIAELCKSLQAGQIKFFQMLQALGNFIRSYI